MLTRRNEASGLEFSVSPETGGELASLRARVGGGWIELLHRAADLEAPPRGQWRGRAPWLFPAVGRSYTEDQLRRVMRTGVDERLGSWKLDGVVRPMPIHGLVMDRVWHPIETNDGTAACRLTSDAKTRLMYPFDFALTARYNFCPGGIAADLEVYAGAGNRGPMPFSIGNHLSLKLPLVPSSRPEDCRVSTPAREAFDLSPQSLFNGRTRAAGLEEPLELKAYSPLLNAVLGGYEAGDCRFDLLDPSGLGVRVSQVELEQTAVPYADPARCLFVLWRDLDAGFFCPEPWIGGPNSLNDGKVAVRLPPGERFLWRMRVEILR